MDRSSQPVAAAFAPMQERQGLRSRAARRLDRVHTSRLTVNLRDARNQGGSESAGGGVIQTFLLKSRQVMDSGTREDGEVLDRFCEGAQLPRQPALWYGRARLRQGCSGT